ncbi:MAG: MFS transporter [Promicromonosporaceae bacterium]|nr:MFS transporter [Promicromonosporaceae bacterium]
MSDDAPLFPFRSVVLGAFVPTLFFSTGTGALLPVIVPTATGMGSTLGMAGFVASLLPIGTIIADLPAGALADRLGDRKALIYAGLVAAGAFALAALAPSLWLLGLAALLLGAAGAVFGLARHSYLTIITPPLKRARVLSTLGGVHRVGNFIGPFLGAWVIAAGGGLSAAMWLGVGAAIAAAVTVMVVPDDDAGRELTPHVILRERSESQNPEKTPNHQSLGSATPLAAALSAQNDVGGNRRGVDARPTLLGVLRQHRQLFATLGMVCLLIGALRGARNTVIPLWGDHLGIDPATVSLIFGIAGGVDMLLFYPAGKAMDRLGRNWVAIPSVLIMGAALIALPFTSGVGAMAVVAMVLGLGNGIGSGILMTLGSDASPEVGRPQFLGLWRVLQDTGSALGPLIVSTGAALGSLAAGVWAASALGPAAAAALHRWVPRWTVHANRSTRRAAGIKT